MPKTLISQRSTGTKVAFGDVVQLSRERSSDPERDGHERFVGLEHIDPSDLRIRRWGNVADGVTFTSVFRPGQVLFGKRRAYQRKVAVADFSGVCSGDIYVLEPKGNALLPELLPFICQSDAFFEHAVGTSAGSLSPRTNWDSLASFEFTLPPIEEQRRVAVALSTLAKATCEVAVLSLSAARARDSLRRHHFQLVEPSTRDAGGGRELGALVKWTRGLTYDGSQVASECNSETVTCVGIPCIGANGVLDADKVVYVRGVDASQVAKRAIADGATLLIGSNGNPSRVGNCVFVAEGRQRVFGGFLLQALPATHDLLPEYLYHLLASPAVQSLIAQEARGSTGLRNLNVPHLSSLRVVVPDRRVQSEICAVIRSTEAARMLAESRVLDLRNLRSTISIGGY